MICIFQKTMIRKETKSIIIYYYYINYTLFILINTTYIVPFKSLKCTSFQTSCHVGTGVVNPKKMQPLHLHYVFKVNCQSCRLHVSMADTTAYSLTNSDASTNCNKDLLFRGLGKTQDARRACFHPTHIKRKLTNLYLGGYP